MYSKYHRLFQDLLFAIIFLYNFASVLLSFFFPAFPIFQNNVVCSLSVSIFRAYMSHKLRHTILCYLSKVKIKQHKFPVIRSSFLCFRPDLWRTIKTVKKNWCKINTMEKGFKEKNISPKSLFETPRCLLSTFASFPWIRASVKNQLWTPFL